jgi:hypothetical protein
MVVQFEKLKMQNTLNRILSLLVLLPAILFVVTGLRWLVAPAGVALTLGLCMLTALVSGRRNWYYPAILLLSITAIGRIIAWLIHDAALALDLIAPEVIVAAILLIASRRLPDEN